MGIFLAVKQIVDVLYQFRILDYGMVLLALVLMLGKLLQKDSRNFWKRLYWTDYLAAALGILYLLSFIRQPSAKSQFLKTESAFLIYFLGRMYGREFAAMLKPQKDMQQSIGSRVLLYVSYLVVYANFIYKLYVQGMWKLKKVYVGRPEFNIHSDGALYYYKTDLAVGILVALIFIYVLGRNVWVKWITILPVGIYMLFYETQAKAGQIIFLLEIFFMLLWEAMHWYAEKKEASKCSEWMKRSHKKGVLTFTVLLFVLLTVFMVFISVYPPLKIRLEDLGLRKEQLKSLERIFHSRHLIWWDAISYYVQQPFGTRLLGIDLVSETLHNSLEDRFHNLYFKQIYSIGYLGCYLYTAFLCLVLKMVVNGENKHREVRILTAAFWIMFLIMSISMEGLEYTQMSWYPFLLFGVCVTTDRMAASDARGRSIEK